MEDVIFQDARGKVRVYSPEEWKARQDTRRGLRPVPRRVYRFGKMPKKIKSRKTRKRGLVQGKPHKTINRLARAKHRGLPEHKKIKRREVLNVNLRLKGGRPSTTTDTYLVDQRGRILMHQSPIIVEQPRLTPFPKGNWVDIFRVKDFVICYNPIVKVFRVWVFHGPFKYYTVLSTEDFQRLRQVICKHNTHISTHIRGKISHFSRKKLTLRSE